MVKLVSGMGPAAVVLVWQLTCATTQKDTQKKLVGVIGTV